MSERKTVESDSLSSSISGIRSIVCNCDKDVSTDSKVKDCESVKKSQGGSNFYRDVYLSTREKSLISIKRDKKLRKVPEETCRCLVF